ncbi:MAG: transcriptional repressor [Dehalococcoidia bacterium]|nr:transcriptional repressor [Dehalococcoidia bacterium]
MSCYATLKKKGLRLTKPRRVILDYIHDNSEHITAEEIIKHVHQRLPRVNKSTVYRTLELLEKKQCVFKSESQDRAIYHHAEEGHHHHLICSKCGRTIICDEFLFAPLKKTIATKYGFVADLKHVVVSGLCESCANQPD